MLYEAFTNVLRIGKQFPQKLLGSIRTSQNSQVIRNLPRIIPQVPQLNLNSQGRSTINLPYLYPYSGGAMPISPLGGNISNPLSQSRRSFSTNNGPGSSQNGPGSSQNGPSSSQNGPDSGQNGPGSSQNGPGSGQNGPGSGQNGPGSSQNGPGSNQDGKIDWKPIKSIVSGLIGGGVLGFEYYNYKKNQDRNTLYTSLNHEWNTSLQKLEDNTTSGRIDENERDKIKNQLARTMAACSLIDINSNRPLEMRKILRIAQDNTGTSPFITSDTILSQYKAAENEIKDDKKYLDSEKDNDILKRKFTDYTKQTTEIEPIGKAMQFAKQISNLLFNLHDNERKEYSNTLNKDIQKKKARTQQERTNFIQERNEFTQKQENFIQEKKNIIQREKNIIQEKKNIIQNQLDNKRSKNKIADKVERTLLDFDSKRLDYDSEVLDFNSKLINFYSKRFDCTSEVLNNNLSRIDKELEKYNRAESLLILHSNDLSRLKLYSKKAQSSLNSPKYNVANTINRMQYDPIYGPKAKTKAKEDFSTAFKFLP